MALRVSVVGGSPLARKGLESSLVAAGVEVASSRDRLDGWQPVRDGDGIAMIYGNADDSKEIESFVEEHPLIPLVAVVNAETVDDLLPPLRAGALSAVDESDDPSALVAALEAGGMGLSVASPRLLQSLAQRVPDGRDVASLISDEEADWLRRMGAGETVGDIAEEDGYSERALFRNLKALYQRLGVNNRTEALLWAGRHGLLESDRPL
jgi:DNA-binding NarL/FixJ family response regulator